ncbi:unnamed protein product, partial [Mesorhabditis spiculigera]
MNFPGGIYPGYPAEFGFNSMSDDKSGNNNQAVKMVSFVLPVDELEVAPPPPVVICPTEVDHINITLEKNQQCACKDCGKLFNSVWYLKQHAVKHSNDRPFKCKFCFKTYKFRSNLYQHKCPDRQKSGQTGRRMIRGNGLLSPNTKRQETNQLIKSRIEANIAGDEPTMP